jgi:hypothetical protein
LVQVIVKQPRQQQHELVRVQPFGLLVYLEREPVLRMMRSNLLLEKVVELVSIEGQGIAEIVRRCHPWPFGCMLRHDWPSATQNLGEFEQVILHDKPNIHPPQGSLVVVPWALAGVDEKGRNLWGV